ncbi:(2,3-dihydroxybenzoyl)adenylate synthase [Streptomyces violascens]|uniref:2,3-dihydroxybenzoate-AMP ligase n=1 Tax=Streptomyces violascens TaxID=67381 RepID=A0ABQ3QUW1_9ACTN|nr:AMP-binding protein [Streptomyces violascens]GHI41069.1 2,3-dihydroxybenzoate-AMP ligase [Streptomyces violascens]
MLSGCTPWPEEFVDRYWMAGHWRGYTLDSLLRDWARAYGPRTALVHGATRITYAQLNRRVDRMAAGLRLRGMRPGQRVVVQLPNVPEFVSTVFALMRVGAVPVFCPLSFRAPEVSHLVRVTEAVGYVAPSTYQGFDHTAMAADIAAQGPFLRRVFTYEPHGTSSPYGGFSTDVSSCHYFPLSSLDSPPGPALVQSSGEVALFLLSGRTAETLMVIPRTHNDYAYQARASAELVSLTENDVYLAALPAESNVAFGCPGILGTLSVGATVVLAETPEPAECLPLIERERVTVTSLDSDAAQSWIDQLPASRADLSSLRLLQVHGEAPLAIAERIGPELGCRLQRVFARGEVLLALTRPGDPDETVFTTQGRPLSPDDEIRIVGAAGKDAPDGEPGELLARGPYTLRGYYRAPQHNARAFTADGFLRTGVLARRTEDGNLVVAGRAAEQAAGGHS